MNKETEITVKEVEVEEETKKETSFVEKYKRRLITIGIIAALLLTVILGVFSKGYSSAEKKYEEIVAELEAENKELKDSAVRLEVVTKEISIDVINSEIKSIGELATVEYLYTDSGKFEDAKKMFGKELPFSFTTKYFIAKWDGCIKAGVDITKVTAEENKEKKEIIVHIPKAEILSHEIDSSSIETLDEKDGLFNPVKVEDVRIFDAECKAAMEERAIDSGLLDKAFESAKQIISALINTDVVKELGYTITFEVIE